jgi:hypothetical protein
MSFTNQAYLRVTQDPNLENDIKDGGGNIPLIAVTTSGVEYLFNSTQASGSKWIKQQKRTTGTVTIASDGLTTTFTITIPSIVSGITPSFVDVTVKSSIGNNFDSITWNTTTITIDYLVAPAVGNIIYNYLILT